MLEVRPITTGEVRAFRDTVLGVFGIDPSPDPEVEELADESWAALMKLERTAAAFDGGRLVGASGTFDLDLAICGGTVEMGGLTMVAVQPSHRRRGLLSRFIDAHLDGCRERGQAIGGLWSSEAPIYGRFGFGVAAENDVVEVAADKVTLRDDVGRDELRMYRDAASDDEAKAAIVALFDQIWPTRPGLYGRSDAWWKYRTFNTSRPGAAKNRARALITSRDGRDTGFVAYKQFQEVGAGVSPSGRIEIIELHGIDAEAEASLWRFILDVDLFPRVNWRLAPVDCVGPWLTRARRRFNRQRSDGLWIRINDVAAALSARRYVADDQLTFAVEGEPGSFRLETSAGEGRCTSTSAKPELRLSRPALGSIYLGGVRPSLLARARQIDGEPAALARADRLFGWSVEPWCCEIF